MKSEIWLPPAAAIVQQRGPEYLGIVDDADWSLGIGFNRGFFSAFKVKAGKEVWFHFPFPTPVMFDDRPVHLTSAALLWETLGEARIAWVVIHHGGMERTELSRLNDIPASVSQPFAPPEQFRQYYPAVDRRRSTFLLDTPLPVTFGAQLCVMVSAGDSDGIVRFYGAGATFSTDVGSAGD